MKTYKEKFESILSELQRERKAHKETKQKLYRNQDRVYEGFKSRKEYIGNLVLSIRNGFLRPFCNVKVSCRTDDDDGIFLAIGDRDIAMDEKGLIVGSGTDLRGYHLHLNRPEPLVKVLMFSESPGGDLGCIRISDLSKFEKSSETFEDTLLRISKMESGWGFSFGVCEVTEGFFEVHGVDLDSFGSVAGPVA